MFEIILIHLSILIFCNVIIIIQRLKQQIVFIMLDDIETYFESPAEGSLYFHNSGCTNIPKTTANVGITQIQKQLKPWSGVDSVGYNDIRDIYGELLNTSPNNIAFAPATSYSITLVANNAINLGKLSEGKTILVLEDEMGSAILPWQNACKVTKSSIQVISRPLDSAILWTDEIISKLTKSTAIVAIPQVHWCDGTFIDLIKISQALRSLYTESERPWLVIDGTQSIGAISFDISLIQPTFMAVSVHKWLLGPFGLSIIYLDPSFHATFQPIEFHERSLIHSHNKSWDEIGSMHKVYGYPQSYESGARKIDSGGHPNPIIIPMIYESLKLIKKFEILKIENYLHNLLNILIETIKSNEFLTECISIPNINNYKHFIGLKLTKEFQLKYNNNITFSEINIELIKLNIYVAVRYGSLRIAPYIYHTSNDMIEFVSKLEIAIKLIIQQNSFIKKKTLLITGASGWLGQFLFHQFIRQYSVDEWNIYLGYNSLIPNWITNEKSIDFTKINFIQFDLSNESNICYIIKLIKPSVIIHLAALSSPVICHNNPILAERINSPVCLIQAIKEFVPNCLFLFTSTDLVYDGEYAPYDVNESLVVPPETVYGETKARFESLVLELTNGYIFRLSNMLGKKTSLKPLFEVNQQIVFDNRFFKFI